MRRVLASHEHKGNWWRECRDGLGCKWPSEDHAEGARAYSSKQAAMYKDLMAQCKLVWTQERPKPPSLVVPSTLAQTSDVATDHANSNSDHGEDSSENSSEDEEIVQEVTEDLYE